MPLDLAGLLVQAGAVSADDLERAFARQREAGAALDTALLELGLVGDAELVRYLSSASGLPAAPPDVEPDDKARRVLPARVAERYGLAPLRLEGRELSVVAVSPVDLAAMDEIGFMLSLQLVPHVATEWRVRELQSRVYGGDVPERFGRIASAARGGLARAAAPAAPAEEAPPAADAPEFTIAPTPPEQVEVAADAFAPARGAEPASVAPFLALGAELDRAAAPPPLAGGGGRSWWTRGDALAALEAARDRDAVVEVAIRYARQVFSAAAVFGVTRERIAGHDAAGWEGARERCRAVRVAPDAVPMFRDALAAGVHFGPLPRVAGNEQVLAELGRAWPRAALVEPIAVRDRPACILYADSGDEPVAPEALADLLLLGGAAGRALERVLRAGKRGKPQAPPLAAGAAHPVPAPAEASPEHPDDEAIADGALARFLATDAQPFEAVAGAAGMGTPPNAEAIAGAAAGWDAVEPARADAPAGAAPRSTDRFEIAPAADALAVSPDPHVIEAVERLRGSGRGSTERARAIADVVRLGPEAAAALRAAFPGPLDAGFEDAPADERGPVLAAMAALGAVATPFLADLLLEADADRRRCAAELLGSARDPATFLPLAEAALDLEPAVNGAAVAALAAARGHPDFQPVRERLRRELLVGTPSRAARAAHALARLGDADAVPLLVQALDLSAPADAAARGALERLTCRRFGEDADAWLEWWRTHRGERRVDWLFGALEDADREVRSAAVEVLAEVAPPPEPFAVDAPAEERARAARAWRAAWDDQGAAP